MESLTTNEVVALFGLDARRVRKEVEYGLFGGSSPPRFDLTATVYLCTVFELGFELGAVEDRKKLYALIANAMKKPKRPEIVELSPVADLKIGHVVGEVEDRAGRFEAWKRKLVTDDRILGGEPVFPRSRLSVRYIGGLLIQGTAPAEIREDYPYLKDEDIEFAKMYALAYPPIGRPRRGPEASSR
jgi:uncharacterized protein (DUF433 family)